MEAGPLRSSRLLALLFAAAQAEPADFEVPARVKQGEVAQLRVKSAPAGSAGWTAQIGTRKVPLFPRAGGEMIGLLPVSARTTPGAYTIAILNALGQPEYSRRVLVVDARFAIQNIRTTRRMRSLKADPEEIEIMQAFNRRVSETPYWTPRFEPPVEDCMTSLFGVQRYHNGKPSGNYHRGLDLNSPTDRPVKAPAPGLVGVARMFQRQGGTVGLDHGEGVTSHYLHLSKLNVEEGAKVQAGDVIGFVGATGFATGPHLHWGVYVHAQAVNPLQWAPQIQPCVSPTRKRARKRPAGGYLN